jgi:hypothetical protein
MAMTTRTGLGVLGLTVLLVGAVGLWCFTTRKWAAAYQQTNATWRIRGLCADDRNGTPIKGVDITACFWEPVAFKHHWRNPPPLGTTNVLTKTDDSGRFEVTGEGGHVQLKIYAAGYRIPEPWEDWRCSAMNGVSRVDTNVVLTLEAISTPVHEKKASKR